MKLHRIVTLSFDNAPDRASAVAAQLGEVKVETSSVTFDGTPDRKIIAIATTFLPDGVSVDNEGFVVVPAEPRQACEEGIEHVANILAIFGRTQRGIASASPWIALSEVSDSERDTLNASKGFPTTFRTTCSATSPIDFSDLELIQALSDRFAGVALLAECLSASHPVARYREMLRLFENAFARRLSHLEKKLAQFLRGADLGYSRDEVKRWLELRNGNIHGDLTKSQRLVMEPDIRPFLARMEQAAYDILFNKQKWHDPSSERRSTLAHYAATTEDRARDLQITKGRAAKLTFQVSDPFGAFPLDLKAILTSPPAEWWWKPQRR